MTINKNETLKLMATGTTVSLLIIANISNTFLFREEQMIPIIKKYNNENEYFLGSKQCLTCNSNFPSITLSNMNSSDKNEEIDFFHEYKRTRVTMHIRKRYDYVPYFDFDEISEEL